MSDISQRVKYTVEFDATGLDQLVALVKTAKAQFDSMGKTAEEVAANFDKLRNSKIKVTHVLKEGTAAAGAASTAQTKMKVETESTIRAIRELEKELDRENNSLKANVRQLGANSVAHSKLAQEAEKSRRVAGLMAQVLGKSGKVLDDFSRGADAAIRATNGLAKAQDKATTSGFSLLQTYAKFFVIKNTVVEAFNQIREGAQSLDIKKTLRNQISGFDSLVNEINVRTAGTIKEQDLNKSLALMTSFGLETASLPRSMELVAKASIRTGQSTEYLTESFARGVSRMSPLILDNLGIQLKLSDAYEAFAAKVGKSSEALTKNEQIAAVQQATLQALEKTTKGIVLEDSASGAVARFDKAVGDLWLGVKELGGGALQALDRAFESNDSRTRRLAQGYKNLAESIEKLPKSTRELLGFSDAQTAQLSRATIVVGAFSTAMNNLFRSGGFSRINDSAGILNRALYGSASPEDAIRNLDSFRERIQSVSGLFDRTEQRVVTENLTTLAMAGLQRQVERQMEAVRDQFKNTLSEADFGSIEQQLITESLTQAPEIMTKINGLLQRKTGHWTAIRDLAKEFLKGSTDAEASLRRMATTQAQNVVKAKEAQAASLAVIAGIDGQVAARARELEFQDKTHILQIDRDKLFVAEQGYVTQIAEARKDYFDEEKAAEQAANKARIERLNGQRILTIAEAAAADARLKANNAYIDAVVAGGKAIIKAEITKLETIVAQNDAYLAQSKLVEFLGNVVGKTGLDVMKEQNEVIRDNISLLKERMNSLGGRGRGRRPDDEDAEEDFLYEPMLRVVDNTYRDRAREVMRTWRAALNEAAENMRGSDVFGVDTALGVDPASIATVREKIAGVVEIAEKEFGSLRNMLEATEYNKELLTNYAVHMNAQDEVINGFMAHMELMRDMAEVSTQLETALNDVGFAMNSFQDLLKGTTWEEAGQTATKVVTDMTAALGQMAEALENNANAYGLTSAVVGISRSITNNLIKDLRARAAVESLMQGALSAAAFATGNVPGGIAHALAAGMFAAVAAKGAPKAVNKDKTKGLGGAGNMNVARSDVHVHISGTVVQTEAERGVMIQRAIREARAGGR